MSIYLPEIVRFLYDRLPVQCKHWKCNVIMLKWGIRSPIHRMRDVAVVITTLADTRASRVGRHGHPTSLLLWETYMWFWLVFVYKSADLLFSCSSTPFPLFNTLHSSYVLVESLQVGSHGTWGALGWRYWSGGPSSSGLGCRRTYRGVSRFEGFVGNRSGGKIFQR